MGYMNDEKLAKKRFVENELQAMLRVATGGCAARLEYEAVGCEEHVRVTWVPEPRAHQTLTVNVTADSRWAIAKDVMKAVGKRFD